MVHRIKTIVILFIFHFKSEPKRKALSDYIVLHADLIEIFRTENWIYPCPRSRSMYPTGLGKRSCSICSICILYSVDVDETNVRTYTERLLFPLFVYLYVH